MKKKCFLSSFVSFVYFIFKLTLIFLFHLVIPFKVFQMLSGETVNTGSVIMLNLVFQKQPLLRQLLMVAGLKPIWLMSLHLKMEKFSSKMYSVKIDLFKQSRKESFNESICSTCKFISRTLRTA